MPLKPYYLTLDLITPGQLDFLLLLPMFPKDPRQPAFPGHRGL